MKNEEFDADELNLIELAQNYSDEAKARALLESLLWPNGPVCPHCKCDDVYKLTPKPSTKPTRGKPKKLRQGLYCCAACRKQFTVTVGTVFEASHIPISKWVMAVFLLCASKKSMSAHQLHRMLKVTYKTAWFMAHRIRYAMGPDNANVAKLKGEVEVDETYVGGKGDFQTKPQRKTPVVALIERGGNMRTAVVPDVTRNVVVNIVKSWTDRSATVNTDEAGIYRQQFKDFAGHRRVNHSKKVYALRSADGGTAHVNSCESFFGLFKRGVHGSWHHISRRHMGKYADEFAFRWNHRKVSDGERMVKAVEAAEGKRLTYQQVV